MNPTPLTAVQVAADPMRRAILRKIWLTECSVNDLVAKFEVSQPAISFHLRQLREGGFVSVRQQGRQRFYQAKPEAFGILGAYLESFWTDKLAQLKDAAELEARQRRQRAAGPHSSQPPAAEQ